MKFAKRTKLKRSSLCLKELHEEIIDCEGPADWFELLNNTLMCQYCIDILNCNYIKMSELCGIHVATELWRVSSEVFMAVLPVKCKIPQELPKVLHPMDDGVDVWARVNVIIIFVCPSFVLLLK